MEKVKYGGMTFELIPGGFDTFTEGRVILRHQKGGKTLEEIKGVAKAMDGTIDLLDEAGDTIRSMDGYVYAGDIREVENYLIEERLPDPEEPEQSVEEIRADIAVVVFRLRDVREELAEVKAVQDEMLVAMLEGGK